MNDKDKCGKYETYFIFKNEEDFMRHVKNCPDCMREYEKQEKISALIKTAAPVYLKNNLHQKASAVKKLACCFILMTGFTVFTGYSMYDNYIMQQEINEDSCISSLGLPTDDYGFLEI